jgi:predicted NUDIX family phosphoesterase
VYSVNLQDHSTFKVKEEALAEGSFVKKEIVKVEEKNWENWSSLIVKEYLRK